MEIIKTLLSIASICIGLFGMLMGLFIILFGALLCLTLILAIIGIPIIIFGSMVVAGSAMLTGLPFAINLANKVKKNEKMDPKLNRRLETPDDCVKNIKIDNEKLLKENYELAKKNKTLARALKDRRK